MVTIKDIAREAGVSHPTVSLVLNNKARENRISDELCRKVRATATRLGYVRNEIARSMVTGKNELIAFVSTDMGDSSYTGKIQEGVFEEASNRGYAVYFYHLTSCNQQELFQKIREWRMSGVIFHVVDLDLLSAITQKLNRLGVPFGTVNLSNEFGIGITTDDFQGAIDVVEYLTKLGHQRIAYFTIDEDVEFIANRRNGYIEGMYRFAPDVSPRIISSANYEELLTEPPELRPTAVFCVMDHIAMELMRAAIQMGVKIPQDLSLVGFGNLQLAEYAAIPLTSVSQPFREMGSLAATKVVDAIKSPDFMKRNVNLKLKTKLVIRESTANCP